MGKNNILFKKNGGAISIIIKKGVHSMALWVIQYGSFTWKKISLICG